MEYLNTAQELLDFIMRCKSPFHVVKEASDLLNENGYTKLEETKEWSLVPGGKYYVTRNESSVIAFQIPESAFSSYQIIASHSDCPTFKVKGEDPFVTDGHYTRLNVEGYGGMIRSPWFDRPLSLAGRMVVRDGNSVKSVLVDAGRDLVTIPNLPIHLNRDINNGIKYSVQTDMLPILGDETAKDHFYELFLPDTAKEDKEVFALAESLPEPVRSEWKELFAEMIEMKTPEARVYKALDKLEAVLQHNEAPLSTWIPLEYELNQTYGMEEAKASIPFLEAVRNLAVTDTKEKLQKESK